MSKQVEVIAVERGHDGRIVREVGEKFLVAAERLKDGSNWFVPAEKFVAKPARKLGDPVPGAGPKPGSGLDENGNPIEQAPPGAGPRPGTDQEALA